MHPSGTIETDDDLDAVFAKALMTREQQVYSEAGRCLIRQLALVSKARSHILARLS